MPVGRAWEPASEATTGFSSTSAIGYASGGPPVLDYFGHTPLHGIVRRVNPAPVTVARDLDTD